MTLITPLGTPDLSPEHAGVIGVRLPEGLLSACRRTSEFLTMAEGCLLSEGMSVLRRPPVPRRAASSTPQATLESHYSQRTGMGRYMPEDPIRRNGRGAAILR
ncbi:MAG: hypothetical protein QG608_531 [Actinomycetota bacterium]|nr:hypothetical protein [Actinomycetota bacterium]